MMRPVLWLTEADVAALLGIDEALAAVEDAFRLHGEGRAQMPAKTYLTFEPFPGDLRAMPAYLKGERPSAGVKIVNSNPANPDRGLPAVSGVMVVVDPETGLPDGVFAAGTLTALRTGAGGGVAAKHLARKDSRVVGLVGCGRQADTQLAALRTVFPVEKVLVWGKTREEAEAFVRRQGAGLRFEVAAEVRAACAADIVVTTTPVRSPLVRAEWIAPGTHVNAIGADAPGKQELDESLLPKAVVVVDEWSQASHGGEINVAVTKGLFRREQLAAQLGEIVAGSRPGRRSERDITIFDSTGLAVQDVAVARVLLEKARTLKKGQVLDLNG